MKPDPKMPIVIVEYDPLWPRLYTQELEKLMAILRPVVTASEHIGSTSVPGLAAKPIIDIMAAVSSPDSVLAYLEPLEALGYTYIPEYENILPERRYFNKGEDGIDTYHLHVVEKGKGFWTTHLLFRDYLRSHPETAQQYAALKYDLANRFGNDRDTYTNSKGEFVQRVVNKARASL
jgi:GrpB-like predicted nucleotidyltransferase (UPF0157 family)